MDNSSLSTIVPPPLGQRLGAGISYTVFSIIGTVTNALVAYALVANWSTLRRYPFYTIAVHLIAASYGVLIGQYIVAIPLSFSGEPLFGTGVVLIILSSMDTLFYHAIFFISLLIALQRFCVFFFTRIHAIAFMGIGLHITCTLPWILSTFWLASTTLIGCPKVFRHDGFYYMYRCDVDNDDLGDYGRLFMRIATQIGYIVPAAILVLYVVIFIYIRQRQSKYSAAEAHMLIQAILICCALELEALLFVFLPDLTIDIGLYWISLLLDYVLIFNATLSSVILLLFNRVIRKTIRALLIVPTRPPAAVDGIAAINRNSTRDDWTDHRIYESMSVSLKHTRQHSLNISTICCDNNHFVP